MHAEVVERAFVEARRQQADGAEAFGEAGAVVGSQEAFFGALERWLSGAAEVSLDDGTDGYRSGCCYERGEE